MGTESRFNRPKVSALVTGEKPKDIKSLRSFLGLSGYYARVIQSYATIAAPLTNLLGKGAKFEWNEPQESAHDELKSKLTRAPVLALPDPEKRSVC